MLQSPPSRLAGVSRRKDQTCHAPTVVDKQALSKRHKTVAAIRTVYTRFKGKPLSTDKLDGVVRRPEWATIFYSMPVSCR
jgi:hypothetical protein